jgi:hypothetical protein
MRKELTLDIALNHYREAKYINKFKLLINFVDELKDIKEISNEHKEDIQVSLCNEYIKESSKEDFLKNNISLLKLIEGISSEQCQNEIITNIESTLNFYEKKETTKENLK